MFAARARRALAAGLTMLMVACAGNPAPAGWLPPAKDAAHQADGGWISLEFDKRSRAPRIQGELIAVSEDCVYVLTVSGLRDVAQAAVKTATLGIYQPDTAKVTAWSVLGGLTTLSHGGFLVLTAPAWIIAGIATAHAEVSAARLRHPPVPFARFRPYARFPQGLAPGFDAASLGALPRVSSAALRSSGPAPRPGPAGTGQQCGGAR